MSDNFRANFVGTAGTLVSAYTPEVGSIMDTSLGGNPILKGNNSIKQNPSAEGVTLISDIPSNANWAIEWNIKPIASPTDQFLNLYLQYNKSNADRVSFIIDVPDGVFYVAEQISSGFNVIAGPTAFAFNVNTGYSFIFQRSGTTYSVTQNGTQVLSGTRSGTSAIGQPGFEINDSSQTFEFSQLRTFPTGSPSAALSIAPNDSHILYDPAGWSVTGVRALSVNPGSQFRFAFSGSSYVRAYFDLSTIGSDSITVAARIDQGTWSVFTVDSTTPHIDFSTSMDNSRHQVRMVIVQAPQSDPFSANAIDAIKITSFEVSLFGAIASLTDVLPKRMIVWGDSITRQTLAGPSGSDDARYTYPPSLGDAFNAEFSSVSFGGMGWLASIIGAMASLFVPGNDSLSSWNKIIVGTARVFTAIDYDVVYMGTNDGGSSASAVAASVQGWLAARRSASPGSKIFLILPIYSSTSATGVTNGFNAYQSATPDANVFLIDTGARGAEGVTTYPTASWFSVDGLHFNTLKHTQFSSIVAQAMQAQLAGSGGGGINGTGILGIT